MTKTYSGIQGVIKSDNLNTFIDIGIDKLCVN